MAMHTCDKLSQGHLTFEIDWHGERLALRRDIPKSGERGARFSSEWVSFQTINTVQQKGLKNTSDLHQCFEHNSSNNATMLAAVLQSLGCLNTKFRTLQELDSSLQDWYEQENPPVSQ